MMPPEVNLCNNNKQANDYPDKFCKKNTDRSSNKSYKVKLFKESGWQDGELVCDDDHNTSLSNDYAHYNSSENTNNKLLNKVIELNKKQAVVSTILECSTNVKQLYNFNENNNNNSRQVKQLELVVNSLNENGNQKEFENENENEIKVENITNSSSELNESSCNNCKKLKCSNIRRILRRRRGTTPSGLWSILAKKQKQLPRRPRGESILLFKAKTKTKTFKLNIMRPLLLALLMASIVLTLIVLAKETLDFSSSLDAVNEQEGTNNLKSELLSTTENVTVDNQNNEQSSKSTSAYVRKKFQKVSRGYLNPMKIVPSNKLLSMKNQNNNNNSIRNQTLEIDKIRGIDLNMFTTSSGDYSSANSNPTNGFINSETTNNDDTNAAHLKEENKTKKSNNLLNNNNAVIQFNYTNVKCHKNKYDRIISQKMNMNNLSRPIIEQDGKFNNPFPTWRPATYFDLVRFMFDTDETNIPKDMAELDRELPIVRPTFDLNSSSNSGGETSSDFRVTWIGHSTILIQVDGLNILTDPVFSQRASPSQYFGPKRYREPACDINSLPEIDIVLISHNHYDHLDFDSVRELNNKFGKKCRWLVPLGLGEFMESMSVKNFVELNWWEKDCFHVGNTNFVNNNNNNIVSPTTNHHQVNKRAAKITRLELSIYLTPTQHWSRRGMVDIMKSLWGSFVIVSGNGSSFFFGGDSGYCSVFKEIGKVFGPITGSAIPIGAYSPRWFMKPAHVDPSEAVQIHRDVRSMKSIAIHHGTFALANEPYNEPKKLLKSIVDEMMANNTLTEPFFAINHGESVDFCSKSCL